MNNKEISIKRADVLKSRIKDYTEASKTILTGRDRKEEIEKSKKKILEYFNATVEDWDDWKWQLSNRISDVNVLKEFINLSEEEIEGIKQVETKYRWAISPYYISLMDVNNQNCSIRMQSVPTMCELSETGESDPMSEEHTSPVENITRRYPDRLIIKVTNQCAMFCRHCQRRRSIGGVDLAVSKEELQDCIQYVVENPEIRDVLITGGDTLAISDEMLDWLLGSLRAIPHVEIIRIGTRTPVTMPQRITDELCEILSKHHPVFLNTHFNSPAEITEEVAKATDKLCKAGVPLGNQAVLLNGINNHPYIMRKLNQELLKVRIRPYYIFHPKNVIGTSHFKVKVEEGIEIMEYLRGYTSGLAIPTYIINAPNGKGKTPILPNYIVGWGKDHIKIRTWEGEVIDYPN
jgi:glutamate 2,3-aminomutase